MELKIFEKEDTAMVSILGKLSATNLHDSLRGAVKNLFSKGVRKVLINMSEVIHIDSTGVGELVSAYTSAANEQAELVLYDVPENCQELLEITNLLDIFRVLPAGDPEAQAFFE